MTTEDYISAIEEKKQSKGSFSNVDWSKMPEGVDKARVADALGSGLDPEYASEIKRRFATNQPINSLDYSKVKFHEGPQPLHSPDIVIDPLRSSTAPPGGIPEGVSAITHSIGRGFIQSVNKIGEVLSKPIVQKTLSEVTPSVPGSISDAPTALGEEAGKMLTPPSIKSVSDVPAALLRTIGQSLDIPMDAARLGQYPQVIAQAITTTTLLKKGANPYVAYAAGMLAGVAADPLTIMSVGEIANAYGAERAAAIKSRMTLKTDLVQMDVKAANALAKYAEEAGVSQAHDLAKSEEKVREFMGQLPTSEATGSAGLGPTKTLAIPQGEPKDILLRQQTGPTVPQLKPGVSDVDIPWRKNLLNKHVLTMEETQPVAGKVTFEKATLLPREHRIIVPEKYDPDRPGTRVVPKAEGMTPEIVKPGGVYGEPVRAPEPVEKDIYQRLAESASEETSHVPPTESSSYSPPDAPHKLDEWIGRSTKELGDLKFAQEVAAPTEDKVQDLFRTIRRYAGHQELSRSDGEHMMSELADYIPEGNRRVLITMYNDMGRAPTVEEVNILRQATKDSKLKDVKRLNKSLEALMGQNLNLSDQEGAALNSTVGYYKGMGEEAQKFRLAGEAEGKALLPRLLEKYGGPHLYVAKEEAEKGLFQRMITGKTRFSKPRQFANMVEAAQNGWIPRTMDAAELLGIYHNGINKAASQKYLMNTLEKQGLLNFSGEGATIKGFAPSARMLEKGLDGESNPTLFTKTASSPFPEVQKAMKSLAADSSEMFDNSWFPALERVNRGVKTFNLYLQAFHPKALAAEAISKGYSPRKFMDGLKTIEKNPEFVRSLIRNGLIVNDAKDIGQEIMREVNVGYKGPNPLKLVQKVGDIYTDWVFRKYMTGLKVYNSSVMIRRLTEMGIPEVRAVELAVDDSNRIFGGLNLTGVARSENMQRIFRGVAFAPDWTESKLRQIAAPFGGGMGHEMFGAGELSRQEQSIMAGQARKYWVNMTALATATHLADQLNPFNRVLSVDLTQETGFRDVLKLLKLAGLDLSYFRSKMSPVLRTFATLSDPRERLSARLMKVVSESLPISVQPSTLKKIFGDDKQ